MMEMDILAHEIINPLNIIVGCAELSIIELNNDKEKLLQYLDTIKQQSLICCNLLHFLKFKLSLSNNSLFSMYSSLLKLLIILIFILSLEVSLL